MTPGPGRGGTAHTHTYVLATRVREIPERQAVWPDQVMLRGRSSGDEYSHALCNTGAVRTLQGLIQTRRPGSRSAQVSRVEVLDPDFMHDVSALNCDVLSTGKPQARPGSGQSSHTTLSSHTHSFGAKFGLQ
ncbi:hypothetical protein PoB_006975500 [Plakobranchus ocellatus]|uniref:Uncharacterized protein n=1 Tax=Plakobranchus ocellatus TaxID=259542 RepID=A0AAV4DH02_9GAST|nr:hypothetical protein PoB_006975500 [Plakobranchus ocellatus]